MISFDDLKSELRDIVELVESLPDRYREISFEVLLNRLLSRVGDTDPEPEKNPVIGSAAAQFVIPAKVRAFLSRNSISDEELRALVLVDSEDLHFVREPQTTKLATGQIQWSLLLALKSAVLGGEMSVDPESVRSVCIEKGFYDRANFASNFKTATVRAMFQKTPEPQGEAVRLSSLGEKKLAELIKALTQS